MIAFKGLQPLLAKFTMDPSDIAHEYSVIQALSESKTPPVPGIVGPVEQIIWGGGNIISSPPGEIRICS